MELKELEEKPTNTTPLIYTQFDYYKREEMRKELQYMFNRMSIDSLMEMPDFILAEIVDNFLMTIYNTKNAVENFKHKA